MTSEFLLGFITFLAVFFYAFSAIGVHLKARKNGIKYINYPLLIGVLLIVIFLSGENHYWIFTWINSVGKAACVVLLGKVLYLAILVARNYIHESRLKDLTTLFGILLILACTLVLVFFL